MWAQLYTYVGYSSNLRNIVGVWHNLMQTMVGGFSVPRYCANAPVQNIEAKDVRGGFWIFRHIYKGILRRECLYVSWVSENTQNGEKKAQQNRSQYWRQRRTRGSPQTYHHKHHFFHPRFYHRHCKKIMREVKGRPKWAFLSISSIVSFSMNLFLQECKGQGFLKGVML